MNHVAIRSILLLLHVVANFVLISFLFRYDITGSWIAFLGFIVLALVLFFLLIKHVLSYIYFIKTKIK